MNYHWPKKWKLARCICVPKPGKDPKDVSSYRMISLLSSTGKVCEASLAADLREECSRLGVIPDFQFGFRAHHSTAHPLLRIVKAVGEAMVNQRYSLMVTLDIEKAFDTTWHLGLLYKMIIFGFSDSTIRRVHAYLYQRKFFVSVDGADSEEFQMTAGVPQGSVVGPILYTIFYADVPEGSDTMMSAFADDTGSLAFSVSVLLVFRYIQHHLNDLYEYYQRWKTRVNASKTKAIVFTRRRLPSHLPDLSYGGQGIQVVQEVKVLGVKLSRRLNFSSHVRYVLDCARTARKRLWKLLSPRSHLPAETSISMFVLFLRSIMTCNAPVWSYLSASDQQKLESFQCQTLRMILGLRPDPISFRQVTNSTLIQSVDLPRIREFAKNLSRRLFDSMVDHENPLIRRLTDFARDESVLRRQRSPFHILLEE